MVSLLDEASFLMDNGDGVIKLQFYLTFPPIQIFNKNALNYPRPHHQTISYPSSHYHHFYNMKVAHRPTIFHIQTTIQIILSTTIHSPIKPLSPGGSSLQIWWSTGQAFFDNLSQQILRRAVRHYNRRMKAILVALLLVSAFSVRLNLSANPSINDLANFFTLSTQEAQGSVTYACQGLPQGFIINGNQLVYTGNVALQGQFPVKVTATDANGQTDTQIILLSVNLSGKGAVAYPSAAAYQTVNGVLNTISTVSSSPSSSPVASSSSSSSSISSSTTSSSSSSESTTSSSSGSSTPAAPSTDGSSSGAQILTVNGVNYNFGNSLSLNLNTNNGGIIGTIGNPSTTSSSSSSSSTADINSLVTQYSQNTGSSTTTSQTISSYPTVVVTGNLPNPVPNTQVIQITTEQSARGNQAINTLSEYDRNITDLFNLQTQVSQTIANLLEIIRQGTANRQKAQNDVNSFTASLNTAVNNQQQLALTITHEEGKVQSIQSAISGATAQLDNLNGQINKVNGQINTAKSNGLALTQQLSVALNNQNGIKGQITTVTNSITTITNSLQSQSDTCKTANQAVLVLKGNITALLNSIAGIDQRVAGIDNDISGYNAQIAALQKQINDLNNKIAQANSDKQALINLNYTVPQQVANINAQIAVQQASCQNTYSPNDLSNANAQLTTLQKQLADANNLGDGISANITIVKGQLTELLNQNANLQQQVTKTQSDLNALKQQLPNQQASLSKLYLQGNQAIQLVQSTNSSLQAAVARFQQESTTLTAANLQLQQARTQQQQISQKINLIIQENSAGLPFPSAPAQCGLSAQLSQINSIDSISLYLLAAYGSGLDFSSLSGFSALNRLYSFASGSNFRSNCPDIILSGSSQSGSSSSSSSITSSSSSSSSSTSSSSSSSSSTSSSGAAYSGLGTVIKVNGNSITVNTSQGAQTINLDNCTIRLANLPGYNLSVGDVLVWKGPYNAATTSWTASQVTCFH